MWRCVVASIPTLNFTFFLLEPGNRVDEDRRSMGFGWSISVFFLAGTWSLDIAPFFSFATADFRILTSHSQLPSLPPSLDFFFGHSRPGDISTTPESTVHLSFIPAHSPLQHTIMATSVRRDAMRFLFSHRPAFRRMTPVSRFFSTIPARRASDSVTATSPSIDSDLESTSFVLQSHDELVATAKDFDPATQTGEEQHVDLTQYVTVLEDIVSVLMKQCPYNRH